MKRYGLAMWLGRACAWLSVEAESEEAARSLLLDQALGLATRLTDWAHDTPRVYEQLAGGGLITISREPFAGEEPGGYPNQEEEP